MARKNLPGGTWVTFKKLDGTTTEEELQAALWQAGINVELDQISIGDVNQFGLNIGVVSLDKLQILDLVKRATCETKLRGRALEPVMPEKRK
jgi:hypothetical protein